ncbi:MAG: pyridoxamine 5'-phosphate oxidase family protein [Pseudomonadales bacterium]|nr:pyridoxamine 5'-phosphate oxidase family protein [Pseudomonadales bacterium]MDP4766708.1 pyridoxamine 5'-phosphate oxidase family protein [Pseudomonadales bacterium]MDP4875864.1 pyridoxamine 5'-phosphate oxidase family protein [Pseudomonadales bacterium]MDP5058158.1 pyridoxamine 5'-phosphate oxidase family protein [Pseudomonadales bacterium]
MTAISWQELEQQAPELATFGKARIDGKVAYLATIRHSGWPRTHPVTPIVGAGRCFIFADPDSPKVRDLLNAGKFCLHCGMSNNSGASGEFQITGVAEQITEPLIRAAAEAASNFRPAPRYVLFELKLSEALSTRYFGGLPERQRWSLPG